MEHVELVLQIVIGIICCLFGLKFQKGIIAIIGFGIGCLLGNYIVEYFSIADGLSIVLRIGLGLVLGAFSFTLVEYLLAIIVGLELFVIIGDMFHSVWYGYIIGLIVGILGGVFTKAFYKLGVILATSLIGSHLISQAVQSSFNMPYLLLFGIIFIASVLFQVSTTKELHENS